MASASWDEGAEEARLRDMEREAADLGAGALDYYILLNVSRQASTEDIRDAYKRLSRLFHLDRHHNAEKREWAQRQFHSIQRAYEVLTDPHCRAAYDRLGEDGIRISRAVGHKVQSPRDLMDAFEREARQRRIEEVEHFVRSKSTISVNVNSMKLTSPAVHQGLTRAGLQDLPLRSRIDLSNIFMKHSFTADLLPDLAGTVSGQMFSRQGQGSGNVVGTLKYTLGAQSWVSLSAPALPPYIITVKGVHQQSPEAFCSAQVIQHAPDLSTPPSATVTLGRALTSTMTGLLTVRTGNQYALGPFWENSPTRRPRSTPVDKKGSAKRTRQLPQTPSGVTLGISGTHGDHGEVYADVTAGLHNSYVTAKYKRSLDNHFSVSVGATAVGVGAPVPEGPYYRIGDGDLAAAEQAASGLQGVGDVSVNVELLGTIDDWTQLEWKVDVSLASGVKATIALHRMGHKLCLPILLTPLVEPAVILGATLLPLAAALGLHYGVLRPRRRWLIEQRMAELKEEQRSQLHQQKRHAEEAVRLMAPSIERSRNAARATGGLVIESALYGDLPFEIAAQNSNKLSHMLDSLRASRDALSSADEPRACDVTLALQALVADDQLVVAAGGSKRSLPGFYDPAFGAQKSLYVRYRFRGRLHETLVADDAALVIPVRAHAIE